MEVQKGDAGGEDCPAKDFVFVSTNGGVKEGGYYVVKEVVLVKEAVKEVVDRARTTYMCLLSPLSTMS